MLTEIFPFSFHVDPAMLAGLGLWSLALYLGFSPVSEWVTDKLEQWMNFAERSLYSSTQEYERNRQAGESLNAFFGFAAEHYSLPDCGRLVQLGH